ncbi:hypothetical protein CEXT_104151 [Caerostris extrusa]|uniref:ATP synthase F0 subunit 8 n=1 Tax=Caerostris extrusa TaxID=172846 RepID=A0AAV4N5J9_CAEEX|nr:hypothetical protein CEXT_104151 [Caerostris extrusa]
MAYADNSFLYKALSFYGVLLAILLFIATITLILPQMKRTMLKRRTINAVVRPLAFHLKATNSDPCNIV